jgi:hypothetical protein
LALILKKIIIQDIKKKIINQIYNIIMIKNIDYHNYVLIFLLLFTMLTLVMSRVALLKFSDYVEIKFDKFIEFLFTASFSTLNLLNLINFITNKI